MAVYVDLDVPADELRQHIYRGDLIVLTRLQAVRDFVEHTRTQLAELFDPYDPEEAHEHFEPAEMAKMLGVWKPNFIHSDTSKKLVREIIRTAGFAPADTHYDVPKPRTSFPVGHLTTGVAFAFPWHRDVWYAAPAQQVNWWLPIFPVREDNAMAFDLAHFAKEVPNNSEDFDSYENNAGRLTAASQVTKEARPRPGAYQHQTEHGLALLPAPGEVLLFSGAQLHTSIPNTSGRARYSVDFRTVDTRDLQSGRGAPLPDVYCTGTAIRDFVSVKDESAFDEEFVRSLYGAPPADAMLVFGGSKSASSESR
jgi:hypothetical protein